MRDGLRAFGRWAVFFVASGCALAAGVGQLGRIHRWPDMLNHFAPLWLLGGLTAAAAGALLFRGPERRKLLLIASLAVAVPSLTVAPETLARLWPGARSHGETLKIIQFNTYVINNQPVRAVDWLLAEDPDVIVIEEGEGLPRPQVMRLLARYPYCSGCAWNWSNMILAKQAAVAEGRFEQGHGDSAYPILGGWSRFAGAGGEYTVMGVHLGWPWNRRHAWQSAALADYVNRSAKDRTIVTGDFNMTPWSFALRRQDRLMGLPRLTHGQLTWPGRAYFRAPVPTPFPYLPLDQVYAGKGWRKVSIRRGPNLGSDHYPLVVVLAARP